MFYLHSLIWALFQTFPFGTKSITIMAKLGILSRVTGIPLIDIRLF